MQAAANDKRNLRDELKGLSNQAVRDWLLERRARWQIGIENSGIDGNVGASIRTHNLYAGGGVLMWGKRKYHRTVSMGTYHYEPITHQDTLRDHKVSKPIISIENDPRFPSCDSVSLPDDALYVLGHDGIGLSRETLSQVDARLGPPTGWRESLNPSMLSGILMNRLRTGSKELPVIEPVDDRSNPSWTEGWESWHRPEQREHLPQGWWMNHLRDWEGRNDWWIWAPHGKYNLNQALMYRLSHAARFKGFISPSTPANKPAHWLGMDTSETLQWIADRQYPLIGLEQDKTKVSQFTWPSRGVLVVGGEQDGLGELCERCDDCISLPQWGSGRSISVSVAASVALSTRA